MNIRIAALVFMFFASLGFAQESRQALKALAVDRSAMLGTLQKGKRLAVNHEEYRHLPEVLAMERSGTETPQEAIARIGAGGDQILESKGRLVLFRSNQQKPAFVERIGGSTVYPAVMNTRTGALGVLTGTLVVEPKNMGDVAAIATTYGLEVSKEYPNLHTVFYRVKANADVADIAAALQIDPQIESAYPEIIEHVRVPK